MDFDVFSSKVALAAGALRSLCSTGNPTEDQVKEVARRVELPVTWENSNYVADPVRLVIVVKAYNVPLTVGVTIDQAVERAWRWLTTERVAMTS